MTKTDQDLVPVFIPSLGALLLAAEDEKGSPLTEREALKVRDDGFCVMMPRAHLTHLDQGRGYKDLDPENCWFDFQQLRRSLGRKPDRDPGARTILFERNDPALARAVEDARRSLGRFRKLLAKVEATGAMPMIKIRVVTGKVRKYLWLNEVAAVGKGFSGRVFELPPGIRKHRVGDTIRVAEAKVVDWMVNDGGVVYGGYSIRVHRKRLGKQERAEFDRHVGAREFR